MAEVLIQGARQALLSAAHDISDGGLAQTLTEMALRTGLGATVVVPEGIDPFVLLFSESTARAVVAVPPQHEADVLDLCSQHGQSVVLLGRVTTPAEAPDPSLTLVVAEGELVEVSLDALREVHEATLPRLVG